MTQFQEKNTEEKAAAKVLYDYHDASGEIAKRLISTYYPELSNTNFLFMCRDKASKSAGTLVPGAVKKANPIERELSRKRFNDEEGAVFIMTVALEVWNNLDGKKRVALVDHLLARCVAVEDDKTGAMKYSLRRPTVQEFPEIAERNGQWTPELTHMANSLKD